MKSASIIKADDHYKLFKKSLFVVTLAFIAGLLLGAYAPRLRIELQPTFQATVLENFHQSEFEKDAFLTRISILEDRSRFYKNLLALTPSHTTANQFAVDNGQNLSLPYFDLILAIFSGSGDDAEDQRSLLRRVYERYDQPIVINKKNFRFMTVFIVGNMEAPSDGILDGDIFYIPVPEGYRHIVHKTKGMLALTKHLRFKYLMKADDDTFVCIHRILLRLDHLPDEIKSKVYGGIPTYCGIKGHDLVGHVITDESHKWYDKPYHNHTMGSMDCYPPYHQGAGYLLSFELVDFLYNGRNHLLTFINEDVTLGTWLMGVDRELVSLSDLDSARLWECTCASYKYTRDEQFRRYQMSKPFFHNCKQPWQVVKCVNVLGIC